jgi:hypothetical protein
MTELVHPSVLTLASCEKPGSDCLDRRRHIDTAGYDDLIASGEQRLDQRDERVEMPQRRDGYYEDLHGSNICATARPRDARCPAPIPTASRNREGRKRRYCGFCLLAERGAARDPRAHPKHLLGQDSLVLSRDRGVRLETMRSRAMEIGAFGAEHFREGALARTVEPR